MDTIGTITRILNFYKGDFSGGFRMNMEPITSDKQYTDA